MYEDSLHCYLRTFTRDQTWDQGHLRQEMVFVLSVTNGCCGWWNNIFLILTAIKIKWTQSNHNKIINDIIKSWRFEYSLQQILFFQLHYTAHTQYPSNIEVKVSMDLPCWSPSTSGHQNIQHEHWQASKVSRAAEDTLCDSRHQLTMTMKRTQRPLTPGYVTPTPGSGGSEKWGDILRRLNLIGAMIAHLIPAHAPLCTPTPATGDLNALTVTFADNGDYRHCSSYALLLLSVSVLCGLDNCD